MKGALDGVENFRCRDHVVSIFGLCMRVLVVLLGCLFGYLGGRPGRYCLRLSTPLWGACVYHVMGGTSHMIVWQLHCNAAVFGDILICSPFWE
jgi:hypothetical protein